MCGKRKMKDTEVRLGLTNTLKRLAFYYLTRGFGKHTIDHPVYDTVEVSPLYDWMPNPENDNEYGAGIRVSFYRQGHRTRFVEFGIRFIGGGGDPTVFLV